MAHGQASLSPPRRSPGTPRDPGADLSRVPWGWDLRALRAVEGIRAATAFAFVILANEWLGWPPLLYMAMATFFTCLCDVGGPIRFRVPALLAFTVLGALLWASFGLLRGAGLAVVLPMAFLGLLCLGFSRVWGPGAAVVGNILSIVLIIAANQPLSGAQALMVGGMFLAGGVWATLLTMVVWRLHPYRPARTAVAACWRRLATLAADQRRLLRMDQAGPAVWDAHSRAHRRAVREEIEFARVIVLDLVSMRGRLSLRGSQALLRLEACDQIFGSLIALSDLLEGMREPARRHAAETLLRVVRPMLVVLANAIETDVAVRPLVLDRAAERALAATQGDPVLRPLAEAIVERLRIAARLSTPGGYLPGGPAGTAQAQPWRERVLGPLRANLNWQSATLRHALRIAVIGAPSLGVTLDYGAQFAHWLPITAVVTLQPFFAITWQRALERIGGTVLGGLVGALIAYFVRAPLQLAAVLFPLCALAFGARQVSFTAWIAGITPVVVVLMELLHPGHSSWAVAGLRALFTLAGGFLAILGCLLLWPSWEPARLSQERRAALAAHAAYSGAVLSEVTGETPFGSAEGARRAAGMATNNLEASISRALQEPHGSRHPEVGRAILVDSILRRIAGRLSALRHDPAARAALSAAEGAAWRAWITASLGGLAKGRGPVPPRPAMPLGEALLDPLARIARQIELLEGALQRPATETG
ncbi:FUSC family protein [Roseomonas sp. M0104]|uniref:FUSC family protein n=1 Tax=Teichococcus coralli TaxID=2545983 RepID=A0A845BE41_9PROT|nr:FUSC family protein [Pseudoroseomonas coralli]MXP63552.1 FUSC family protein [Pseudoroseomonas coralli]